MTVRRWCVLMLGLAVLAVVVAQIPAQAGDDKDKVTWLAFDKKTYPKGFFQTLTTKTSQTMKVMGQELTQKQDQTFYIKWEPEDVDAKGNWVVKQKIIGVKMAIDIGGNKIEYDSIPPNPPPNPLTDFFKKLESLELKFTVSPEMKVVSISGREQFIEELGKVSPQMKPLLEKILSQDALIAMADPTWAPFPKDRKMKLKNSWDGGSTLDLGPIGIYKTTFKYTVEGKEKDDDKIGVTSSLTYEKPGVDTGLPFKIKEGSKLTGTDGKGTVIFNRAKGRIEKSDMTMKLAGKLVIEVGGMVTDVEITQDQSATSVASDNDPVLEARDKLSKEKK